MFIRSLPFLLLVVPATLFFSALAVIFRKNGVPHKIGVLWSKILLSSTPLKFEVDLENLRGVDHCVFMCNHQSYLDINILYHYLGQSHNINFVAKKSLFDIPVFGKALLAAGHIPIDRSNRRAGMKSIEQAVEKAQAGANPLIFPEGTRNSDLSMLSDFKIGGMILALKCGLPVVPVVLAGAGKAMDRNSFTITPGTVKIKALPPIDPGKYTLKEREKFKQDVYKQMNSAYMEMMSDYR